MTRSNSLDFFDIIVVLVTLYKNRELSILTVDVVSSRILDLMDQSNPRSRLSTSSSYLKQSPPSCNTNIFRRRRGQYPRPPTSVHCESSNQTTPILLVMHHGIQHLPSKVDTEIPIQNSVEPKIPCPAWCAKCPHRSGIGSSTHKNTRSDLPRKSCQMSKNTTGGSGSAPLSTSTSHPEFDNNMDAVVLSQTKKIRGTTPLEAKGSLAQ